MNLKHLFFLAVAGTLAVACSEVNENSLTDGDGQRMLRTISSGNDRFTTRLNSETSEWENGDAIGIYMFDTEDKNVLNDALNVKYTTIGEGLTANFSSDPGIAIYDMPTNFVAYYPHTTSADVIDATAAIDFNNWTGWKNALEKAQKITKKFHLEQKQNNKRYNKHYRTKHNCPFFKYINKEITYNCSNYK